MTMSIIHYEKDEPVAMEYGVREGEEFTHCYVIPLTRDFTQEETLFIVEAWQYVYNGDFDIEIQTCMMLTQTMTWILIKL